MTHEPMIEYLAVALDRVGKIEDVVICNAYSLAKRYAENFADLAPPDAIITVYECKQMAVYSGRRDEPALDATTNTGSSKEFLP